MAKAAEEKNVCTLKSQQNNYESNISNGLPSKLRLPVPVNTCYWANFSLGCLWQLSPEPFKYPAILLGIFRILDRSDNQAILGSLSTATAIYHKASGHL